jgi:hypothetical protein
MVKIYVLLSTVLNTFKSMRAVCRIWDVYPGSGFFPFPDPGSRIPDLKTAMKDIVGKNL